MNNQHEDKDDFQEVSGGQEEGAGEDSNGGARSVEETISGHKINAFWEDGEEWEHCAHLNGVDQLGEEGGGYFSHGQRR